MLINNDAQQKIFNQNPFNWRTPAGYLACCIMQIPFGAIAILIFLSIMSLIVGFCVILAATTQDLQCALRQLNEMSGKKQS